MNLFLLFCVPATAFLLVWHFFWSVKPPRPVFLYSSSVLWGLGALLLTFPLQPLTLFNGDFGVFFVGSWLNNGLIGPGLLLGAFYWRHRHEENQSLVLLRLTLWFSSYFTFLSLSDFFTTRIDFGIPELFVIPLTWVLVLGIIPPLYLRFRLSRGLLQQLIWIGAGVGLGLGIAALGTLAFSPWAWVSWILTLGALFGAWRFLDLFYAPLSKSSASDPVAPSSSAQKN